MEHCWLIPNVLVFFLTDTNLMFHLFRKHSGATVFSESTYELHYQIDRREVGITPIVRPRHRLFTTSKLLFKLNPEVDGALLAGNQMLPEVLLEVD